MAIDPGTATVVVGTSTAILGLAGVVISALVTLRVHALDARNKPSIGEQAPVPRTWYVLTGVLFLVGFVFGVLGTFMYLDPYAFLGFYGFDLDASRRTPALQGLRITLLDRIVELGTTLLISSGVCMLIATWTSILLWTVVRRQRRLDP